jgi:hypothetical protein
METRALKPHLTIIGLLVLTSLTLGFTVDVNITDVAGVKAELPDTVGAWRGEALRYCQNGSCQAVWLMSQIEGKEKCPKCDGALDPMSPTEKALLPPDTILVKKEYKNEAGRRIFASVVMSGKERASIHRPELCLVGQGSEFIGRSVLPVNIDGRKPLGVMVLDMLHRRPQSSGPESEAHTYYAYWFAGNQRETPHHWQRMLWMATDRVFHNLAHRWAYIAVSGSREAGSDAYREEIAGFIHGLYPRMLVDREGPEQPKS